MRMITETVIENRIYPVVPPIPALFLNFYRHLECGTDWESEWDCMCNDKCPKCGAEIEPYESIEIGNEEET